MKFLKASHVKKNWHINVLKNLMHKKNFWQRFDFKTKNILGEVKALLVGKEKHFEKIFTQFFFLIFSLFHSEECFSQHPILIVHRPKRCFLFYFKISWKFYYKKWETVGTVKIGEIQATFSKQRTEITPHTRIWKFEILEISP